MISIFHSASQECSRVVTKKYSTSFASAIRLLNRDLRAPIYNIYGLVRFADEIVDTFHDYPKKILLEQFKAETLLAISRGISLNPILQSFQLTVNKYHIDLELIEDFFASMEMDLEHSPCDQVAFEKYIYGSAEVVGLLCLQVFCEGDRKKYLELKPYAQSLGAAFQKVNFLRDIKADFLLLERTYFPGVDFNDFGHQDKCKIEMEIEKDFDASLTGIKRLPVKARFGVYVAYRYYRSLFNKIRTLQPERILQQRVRIPGYQKMAILIGAGLQNRFSMAGLNRNI